MEEKQKKKSKTPFKDMIWDYYTTNREITKYYDAEHDREKQEPKTGSKRGWQGNEKLYTGIIIVGLILIAIKYLVF